MLGETLLSWNLMNPNNPSGKFLKSLHRLDDALWSLGSKKLPKKICVPELEMLKKTDPHAEKELADKLGAERAEAKNLVDPELIELANKIKLGSQFNIEKLNFVFEEDENKNKKNFDVSKINKNNLEKKENELEVKSSQEEVMLVKANLIPVFDFLLKEKFEKENLNENDKNNEEELEENDYENNEDDLNHEEDEEELEENDSENNNNKKYMQEENLEYSLEKITKFNSYYDYLESELKKYIELKTSNNNKDSINQDPAADKDLKENMPAGAEGAEKDEASNKKVKQHKKKNKNKKKPEDNLIDISVLTSKQENPEADEAEIKKLQNEFLKLNFSFDLELETLKAFRNQLFKLSEFIIYALITFKAKSNPNFMVDPKFLQLITSYKQILEEAEKIKLKNQASKEAFTDSNNQPNNNNEENEDSEILLKEISPEEMDENINLVFFSTLKLAVLPKKDELFPLDAGKLLKDYLKPMANELEVLLDFRVSSFKKINNYLKSLAKNDELIVFGKPKGMQNDYILSVNWQAEKIKNFMPPVKKAKFLSNKPAAREDDRENVILNKDEKIELMQMFKPNGIIVDIFKKYDKGYER